MNYKLQITNYKKLTLSTLLVLLSVMSYLFFVKHQASAQSTQQRSFTITPPTIQKALNPGDTAEGMMKIVNETEEPLTFTVDTQDFIVEDTKGTPRLLPDNTLMTKYSAASWIGTDQPQLTVGPRQRVELRYYIQVPKDARPGGHYAAAVFRPNSYIDVKGTGTAVNTVVGTLFYINVSGEISEFASVTNFFANAFQEYGPVNVLTQIRNAGDLHIRPQGTITVTNPLGKTSQVVKLTEANIFPGAARDIETAVGQKWMLGRYKVQFSGTYGKNNTLPLMATLYFWVFPWKIAIVIVLIIIAVILGIIYMKKRKGDNTPLPSSTMDSNTNNTAV